jgi:hypothetical protein
MAEEKSSLEIDDWLDDLAEDKPVGSAEEVSGELEQSDLDDLFGSQTSAPVFASGGGGEDFSELEQSDIDSLLGTGEDSVPEAGDDFDLDQSEINSLLGSGEAPVLEAGEDFDLDQSDIDDLFAGAKENEGEGEAVRAKNPDAPSEDDVEQLFAGLGEDAVGKLETVGFAEVAREEEKKAGESDPGEDKFSLPDDGGLEDDDFDFGDLPDIPDETNTVGISSRSGMGEEDIFASRPSAAGPDFLEEAPSVATAAESRRPPPTGNDSSFPPPVMAGRIKEIVIAALLLLLLLGGGGYWFIVKSKKVEIPVPVASPVQEKPVAPPNAMPLAAASQWRMIQLDEPLSIELGGSDADNDPLKFEIVTPPGFGKLVGDPPQITYLANQDFPGEDRFEFRVFDGRLASCPAWVVVMGPEKTEPAVTEAVQEVRPQERPVVRAKNVRLKTLSTVPLIIDWKKIWAGANASPFSAKVSVEILSGPPLRGMLSRLDSRRHRYEPERYFGGTEVVRYRFKAGGMSSPERELVLEVMHSDMPPVLVLQPVADSYKVGERVLLDARDTSDDSPGRVQFDFEQLSGPPVYLEKLNGQDSARSFVVPSFFRSEQKTRIVIRVTATDSGGQRTRKEIGIIPVSKRQTALWGGTE